MEMQVVQEMSTCKTKAWYILSCYVPVIGALTGAATGATTQCVSCDLLVTDGGTRALLMMACTFALSLPFPPLLVFFLGVPDGTSPEALGGADLDCVCSE